MDIVTLAAAMAYTKKTADALGAVKGAPCTITAIEPIAGGHKITFEWKSTSGQIETDTLDIMDGAEGQQGQTGPEGPAGPAGVSPLITIEQITGGHRVTITDAQHPQGQSFDVMDGNGGSGIPAGGRIDQVLAKRSSTDGDANWQQIGFKRYEEKYCPYWLAGDQEYSNVYGSLDEYGADFYGLIYDVSKGHDYGRLVFLDGLLNGHSGMALYLPTERNMNHKLGLKQDKLTAGDNITLTPQQDGTIKIDASGGTVGGNANFDIGTIPLGGSGVYEVNAILNNGDNESVRAVYSRGANGELPEWFHMSVNSTLGSDTFEVATKGYADGIAANKVEAVVIDVANFNMPMNEFVTLFYSDKLILIKDGSLNHLVTDKYTWDLLPETEYELSYIEGNISYTYQFETSDDIYYRGRTVKPVGYNLAVGEERLIGTYKEAGLTYNVYSKVIKINSLPSAPGTTTYDHGITGIKQILQVYGFCSNGFVMNAPRQSLQDNISVYQVSKSTGNEKISIEVGKDRSSLSAYVCLVYSKNN